MPKTVGIKFRKTPKVYNFLAGDFEYTQGCGVNVETAKGTEYGTVVNLPYDIEDENIVAPLKAIERLATSDDTAKIERFEAKYDETMTRCQELIEKSGLAMKLVDVEFTFDESKLIVHFTADGRVDFRELVRQLASAFRLRIELRQIGSRDECRMIGGLGSCGRVCCCKAYLNDFAHVTIKMAKNQNLSLNPAKISGLCGRLMCCLEFENAHYAETNKKMPKLGSTVKTKDGKEGTVITLMQLKDMVRLKIIEQDVMTFNDYKLDELEFVPRTANSGGECNGCGKKCDNKKEKKVDNDSSNNNDPPHENGNKNKKKRRNKKGKGQNANGQANAVTEQKKVAKEDSAVEIKE